MKIKTFSLIVAAMAGIGLMATTLHPVEVTCGNCGAGNTVTVIGSTNQLQAPDLDWRPGEMMRSTLRYRVAECSKCHYCAPDLRRKPRSGAAKKIISAPMRGNTLADCFVRAAEIWAAEASTGDDHEKMSAYFNAGDLFLCAAWCCDDAGKKEQAIAARREALKNFEQAIALAAKVKQEIRPELTVMMCDIYRRVGDFPKAEKAAREVLNYKSLPQRMAELQLKLCREKKTDRRTLDEVSGYTHSGSIQIGGE